APRLHPYPTAVAVRRPSHDRGTGRPYVTVVRRVAPLAVVVEIFVADRLARHVLRRARVVPAAVARGAPVLPVVRPRRVADVVAGRVAAATTAASPECTGKAEPAAVTSAWPWRTVTVVVSPVASTSTR